MLPRLILTALLSTVSLKCAGFPICDSDKDCQDGSSCIENICKICVKCSLIFRKGNTCESDFNDCGDCLEGYEEISVTDNSAVKKPCRPAKKTRKIKECANDNSCPPNNYCSEKSCVKCFDCSLINRLEPEKCAKDLNECGPCLVGYLSVHDTSGTNYTKCEKFPHVPVPYDISIGSVLTAALVAIAVVTVLVLVSKSHKGFTPSKTNCDWASRSGPPFNLIEQAQDIRNQEPVRYYIAGECQSTGHEKQKTQQAIVYQQPSALSEEISEVDSGQNENSYVPGSPTSAETEETISSHRTAIPGDSVRMLIGSLPEVNTSNSGTDSRDEQPVDTNVVNNDSAENNSHLVSEDPAQVPEAAAKEPTDDLPLGQGQM